MPMTLLEIVKEHAARQGLPLPMLAVGGTSNSVQAVALLNEFCEDLLTRSYWESNVREATWTSTATESQGRLSVLAPFGYQGILPGTIWDRTSSWPLDGNLTPQEWQVQKAAAATGPLPSFRIRNNEFITIPALPAGHTIAFEYYSSYFVKESDTVFKPYWTKDTDTCLVDDALPIAYLRWAWKKEKGLEYAEEFAKYERLVATKAARSSSHRDVCFDETPNRSLYPGVLVPQGNWPV